MSGLHASVNMHVSTHYIDENSVEHFKNHSMYYDAIGKYPERIKNIHFVYAIVVRALNLV